jgi:hypothetical protein
MVTMQVTATSFSRRNRVQRSLWIPNIVDLNPFLGVLQVNIVVSYRQPPCCSPKQAEW